MCSKIGDAAKGVSTLPVRAAGPGPMAVFAVGPARADSGGLRGVIPPSGNLCRARVCDLRLAPGKWCQPDGPGATARSAGQPAAGRAVPADRSENPW